MNQAIPPEELERLERAVRSAEEWAQAGMPHTGAARLLRERARAQSLPQPWAPDLAQRYQAEIDAYMERHSLRP